MPSQLSGESFLAVVQKSGLVEADRLKRLLEELPPGQQPDNADALANHLVDKNAITRWQAENLLRGKHKGFFLGKYRLLSLLGKGGMSSVYLAEHTLMRRRSAIKVLPAKRVHDSSYLARFHREAVAVAALDHPNIVRAYDVDHQQDQDREIHFLVMEYVDGSSLQELVTLRGPLPFLDAADYVRQAAVGLAYAHKAGMVHRDIKPGNLLLDQSGVVKILDLGLARYFNAEQADGDALTIQHDERVLGTADYLAPEQALDSHSVDARADIYSLGCTFYFLLTGHPPFTEGTLAQRLMAHQQKEPPPLEQDRPEIPTTLSAIVKKMMAKKPEERYPAAQDVADVLRQWIADNADDAWRRSHVQFSGRGDSQIIRGRQGASSLKMNAPSASGAPDAAPATDSPKPVEIVIEQAPAKPPVAKPVAKPVARPVAKPVSKPATSPAAASAPPPAVGLPDFNFGATPAPAAAEPANPFAFPSFLEPAPSPAPRTETPPPPPAVVAVAAVPTASPVAATVTPQKPHPVDATSPEAFKLVAKPSTADAPSTPASPPPPAQADLDMTFLNTSMGHTPPEGGPPVFRGLDTVEDFAPVKLPEEPLTFEEEAEQTLTEEAPVFTEEQTFVDQTADAEDELLETEPIDAEAQTAVLSPEPAVPATAAFGPPTGLPAGPGPFDAGFPSFAPAAPAPVVPAVAPATQNPAPSPPVKKPAAAARFSLAGNKWVLIGGGGGLAFVLLLGIAAALGAFGSKPKTTAKSNAADVGKAVAKAPPKKPSTTAKSVADSAATAAWAAKREANVGPSGDFKTIGEALQTVKASFKPQSRSDRFTIKVASGTYAERIAIDKGYPDNITIQGTDGAVLEPAGDEPFVRVKDVEGFQLSGFTLKANGRPIAIELSDRLPRCRFQKLNVIGFTKAGVTIRGVVAYSYQDARLFLEDSVFEGAAGAVGVEVSRGTGSDAVDSSHLVFQRCRFLGPLKAGITASGADAVNYEFRECIFADCEAGVSLLSPVSWREFAFVQNTFYKCKYGLLVSEQPPATSKGLTFRRNLFVETGNTEAFIEKGFEYKTLIDSQMLGPMAQNFTDHPKEEPDKLPKGELALFYNSHAGPGITFASTDRQHAKFLAPGDNAPQRAVGGVRGGDKPWVGAVGP